VLARFRELSPPGPAASLAFVPAVTGFRVNGHDVWGLKVLRAGNTLSFAQSHWLLARLYTPESRPVPPEKADLDCSYCGLKLDKAREGMVCACACGALYHAEEPREGEDRTDVLCCYTELKTCHGCFQEMGLEPRLLPSPESLRL
jgi:hypothetical protein